MGRKESFVVITLNKDQLSRSGFTFLVSQRFLLWASHIFLLQFSLCETVEHFIWAEIFSELGFFFTHVYLLHIAVIVQIIYTNILKEFWWTCTLFYRILVIDWLLIIRWQPDGVIFPNPSVQSLSWKWRTSTEADEKIQREAQLQRHQQIYPVFAR